MNSTFGEKGEDLRHQLKLICYLHRLIFKMNKCCDIPSPMV